MLLTRFSKQWRHVRFSCNSLQNGRLPQCYRTVFTRKIDADVPLTKAQADELVFKLSDHEKQMIFAAIQQYQSKLVKEEYEGQLAAFKWRSKFGRPSRLPKLGEVDPTGSYCPVPEDWLMRKYAETLPPPTTKQLLQISIANSIPFIGFGFLDNLLMILAGDYIDATLGVTLSLSTLAAAALGNTISDIFGIGSAYYVERLANLVGLKSPNLSPIQMDMPRSRYASNLGRAFGITLGCLLGMFPLLFLNKNDRDNDTKD